MTPTATTDNREQALAEMQAQLNGTAPEQAEPESDDPLTGLEQDARTQLEALTDQRTRMAVDIADPGVRGELASLAVQIKDAEMVIEHVALARKGRAKHEAEHEAVAVEEERATLVDREAALTRKAQVPLARYDEHVTKALGYLREYLKITDERGDCRTARRHLDRENMIYGSSMRSAAASDLYKRALDIGVALGSPSRPFELLGFTEKRDWTVTATEEK